MATLLFIFGHVRNWDVPQKSIIYAPLGHEMEAYIMKAEPKSELSWFVDCFE